MSENPTFQIPTDVIQPIIKAHVLTAVTGALSNHSVILNEIVSRILSQQVGDDGKPCSYRGQQFIDYLVSTALREGVKAAVTEAIASHQETIRAAVLKELSKRNSPLVKQLVDGMVRGTFDPSRLRYALHLKLEGDT